MKSKSEVVHLNEARKIWQTISKFAPDSKFSYELEVQKKLLDFFHLGPFYHFVFNLATTQIEMVSDLITEVLGITHPEDFTIDYVLSNVHPDDLPIMLSFEKQAGEYFKGFSPQRLYNYKICYDVRIKRTDGRYIRILNQIITIQAKEDGSVIRTFIIQTDISHIKKEKTMSMSYIGMNGEPSFYNVSSGQPVPSSKKGTFTKREQAVLQLLIAGKTSQEIADILIISKFTVDTHRRNILQKAEVRNMAELTLKLMQGNLA